MTVNPGPSWLMFCLLVVTVAIIALFDQMCRPVVVPAAATVTPTLGVTVLPTAFQFLPPSVTPTAAAPFDFLPIRSPEPSATATSTPLPPTGTPVPTETPVVPMRQRG